MRRPTGPAGQWFGRGGSTDDLVGALAFAAIATVPIAAWGRALAAGSVGGGTPVLPWPIIFGCAATCVGVGLWGRHPARRSATWVAATLLWLAWSALVLAFAPPRDDHGWVWGLALLAALAGFAVRAGRRGLGHRDMAWMVVASLAVTALSALAAGSASGQARTDRAGAGVALIILAIVAGLGALAWSSARDARLTARGPFLAVDADRRWIALVAGSVGVLALGAFFVVGVVDVGTLASALRALGPIGAAIADAAAWLAARISELLGRLLSNVQLERPPCPPPGSSIHAPGCSTPTPSVSPTVTGAPRQPPASVQAIENIFIALIVVGGILLLILGISAAFTLFRPRREDETVSSVEETRDAVGADAARRLTMLDLVRSPLGTERPERPRGGVRALYGRVLAAGSRAGAARNPQETPDDYLPRLRRAAIGGTRGNGHTLDRDAADVTAAYDRERYGETPPTDAELSHLTAASRRIVRALRSRR